MTKVLWLPNETIIHTANLWRQINTPHWPLSPANHTVSSLLVENGPEASTQIWNSLLYLRVGCKALVTPGLRPSYNLFTIQICENRMSITETAHDWSQRS